MPPTPGLGALPETKQRVIQFRISQPRAFHGAGEPDGTPRKGRARQGGAFRGALKRRACAWISACGNRAIGNGGEGIAPPILTLQAGKDGAFHCLGPQCLSQVILQNGGRADFEEEPRALPRRFCHRRLKAHWFAQIAPPIFGAGFRPRQSLASDR